MGSITTWSGTISAMGGSAVSGGLGMLNLGNVDGFNSLQIGQIEQLNGFADSMASTAIGYGITGNASFNLVRLNGTGLLEMNLGKDGFNMQLGMGGTDISLGRISGALAGASHWNKNIQIEKAAKRDKLQNAATALRAQYGFGDGMQQAQLESILKGDTVLARGTGTGEAETVSKDGKRTVYLDNYKETMSREEKLLMGITLGHEAYRDGLVGTKQQQFMETTRAVIGHTEMALRMQADKRYSKSMDSIIGGSAVLQKDIAAYKSGDLMTMLGHVAGNYDYSKDYWKLVKEADGSSFLEYDGLADIYDETGDFLVGAGTSETALQKALGKYLGISTDDAGIILEKANFEMKGGLWITEKNQGKRIRIGNKDDMQTTDYIFAAHHIQNIRGAIASALRTEGSVDKARESLLQDVNVSDAPYAIRYAALRTQAINFYLPSTTMFGGVESRLSTPAGKVDEYPGLIHKGNDYVVPRGTPFHTIFSGKVIETTEPQSVIFTTKELFEESRETNKTSHQWFYTHHADRTDSNGETQYLQDQNIRGYSASIDHGFMMNDKFLSMGFYTRSNHFDSLDTKIGETLLSGGIIGRTGNTGWSTGTHVDYNIYTRPNRKNFITTLYDLELSYKEKYPGYYNPYNLWKLFK